MTATTRDQALTATAEARSAVLDAYRLLALHQASFTTYPGHEEASDSLGRALTEVNEAVRALAAPTPVPARVPGYVGPAEDPSRVSTGTVGDPAPR